MDTKARLKEAGIALLILVSVPILIMFYAWWNGRHYVEFELSKDIEVEFVAQECVTCFLDWQIDFSIVIIAGRNKTKYDFFTAEGPYLTFYLSRTNKDWIFVECYKEEFSYIININSGEIKRVFTSEKHSDYDFYRIAEMTSEFKIKTSL